MKKRIIIATLLTATSLLSPATLANIPDVPHLETFGISEIVTSPDMAEINISVTLNRATAKEAKNASDNAIADLLTRLDKIGIEKKDIESANLSVQPQYSYPKNTSPILTGYQATRNVSITIRDLNNLNTVLDGALTDGLNQINNISFSSSLEAKLKLEARMLAIKDAKSKAASLAQSFDQQIAGVWKIRYMNQSPVRPLMMRMSSDTNSINASYSDAKITIFDRVEVIFTIKK